MIERWKPLYWQTKATAKKLGVPFWLGHSWFTEQWAWCQTCHPGQGATIVVCRMVPEKGFTEDNCYLAFKIIVRPMKPELTKSKNLVDSI